MGCDIEILRELGYIDHHQNRIELYQTSYCFVAKIVGDINKPNYTEQECSDGFKLEFHSLDNAIELIKDSTTQSVVEQYIIKRDLQFLLEYKRNLE